MSSPLLLLGLCLSMWIFAWALFAYALWLRGIEYGKNWVILSLYFLSVALVTFFVFEQTLLPVVVDFAALPIIFFGMGMLMQWVFYAHMSTQMEKVRVYVQKFPMRDYLLFDTRRLISKTMDILAQQVFIVVIVLLIFQITQSVWGTILGFLAAFALVHIPPLMREWGSWSAWNFVGAVLVFSVTFPPLILLVPYGFMYTFMIHWLFYTGTAYAFYLLTRF